MATKNKGGRPSKFTPVLAATICRRLMSGESLRSITGDPKMPAFSTAMEWALGHTVDATEAGFPDQYARARRAQAELYADEIIGFSDERGEDPQRSRLQIDARKWIASRLLPKVYGDRVSHEHAGPDGGPIPTRIEIVIVDSADGANSPD